MGSEAAKSEPEMANNSVLAQMQTSDSESDKSKENTPRKKKKTSVERKQDSTDSEEDTQKKKKGAKACTADDDFQAASAENKVEALHTFVEGTKTEPLAAAASEEQKIDLELDAKALANRKKKEKKKAKRNAAVGGEYDGDDAVTTRATDATIDNGAPSSLAAELKNCGKAAPKKESAAARLAREKVDAKRKLDDEK